MKHRTKDEVTTVDTFVEHMSAYYVSEQLIKQYLEDVNNAYKTAVITQQPQVVMGESDLFFVILSNSNIIVCKTVDHYDLMTEKESELENLKTQYKNEEITWKEYRAKKEDIANR